MTPREKALLLRLVAAELTQEDRSIVVIRRTLYDLGWTAAAMDAGVARILASLSGVVLTQAELFERAA